MAYKNFQTIAMQPEIVDSFAGPINEGDFKFSTMFKVFFTPHGYKETDNIVSWLDVFGNNFTFPKNLSDQLVADKVSRLFQHLGLEPGDEIIHNTYEFWLLLFHIYHKLREGGYKVNDNLCEFMNGFPIHETKAVIMGNVPVNGIPSTGYAFHGSSCPSTFQILHFLQDEINKIEHFNGANQTVKNDENFSMNGWIQQGVLLMNACQTLNYSGDVCTLWLVLTDFILKYLNDTKSNLVFILLGNVNLERYELIDPKRHWIMCLYHPAMYAYPDDSGKDRDRDWDTMIPFTNSQFYMYQIHGNCQMDWGDVDGLESKGKEERFTQLQKLFDKAIHHGPSQIGSCERLDRYFIVVRNHEHLLTLKYWPKKKRRFSGQSYSQRY
ncbi:unnamed protein product [Orchesella dallaii]|uniref:Uracil-DNA glycosylase-like domain-containing protein n=1 Tax=Orchesella dallaii TaxID=48710 RepID=A0ABP1QG28_9HEXA